jgi:cardiolipin synthase
VKPRDLPNLISALRIVLVVPVVALLEERQYGAALAVFTLAGLSDALDGFLARRYGWFSRLGGWLDPIADKTMMVSVFVMLGFRDLIPLWLVVAVIGRDLLILAGSVVYYLWIEKVDAAPSWISKLNTLAQILLIMTVLFDRGVTQLPGLVLDGLIVVVVATTVLSGIGYVLTWGARALRVQRSRS